MAKRIKNAMGMILSKIAIELVDLETENPSYLKYEIMYRLIEPHVIMLPVANFINTTPINVNVDGFRD